MWGLDHKAGWVPKNRCFWTVVLEKTLEVPWIARRSNQSILKGWCWCWSWSWSSSPLAAWCEEPTHWGQVEKGAMEDEMIGWYHWLSGHEFEQTPRDREEQETLVWCSPWGRKELDRTVWLNNILIAIQPLYVCFKQLTWSQQCYTPWVVIFCGNFTGKFFHLVRVKNMIRNKTITFH